MKIIKVKTKLDERGKVVGYIDERTGKEYGFPVIFGRKKNPYGNGWIMNSQEALDIIAEDKEIRGFDLRVFLKVCARVDFENWVHLPIKELGEELRIDKAQISRSIKVLVKKGVLLKSEKIGRSYAYRLNPDFGWKGKVTHLEEYRQQQHEDDIRTTRAQFNTNTDFKVPSNNLSKNSPKKSKAEIINFIESNDIDLDKLQEFIKKSKIK
jgi:predicted transcriptional regulator